MRIFFYAVALLSFALGGCHNAPDEAANAPDFTPAFYETQVHYAAPTRALAEQAKVSLEDAPSLATLRERVRPTSVIPVGIVPTDRFDRDDGYEAATLHEALAFVQAHPNAFRNRIGVCARGTTLIDHEGVPAWPVISRRRDEFTAGVWSFTPCNWDFVVARGGGGVNPRFLVTNGG